MAAQERLGLLFILVGPPGVGKNALMNSILPGLDGLRQLPTATTRPKRPTEQQHREHLFVDEATFVRMIEDGELIEWQWIHGERYGVPRATVEQAIADREDLIADIEVLGATHLRSVYPDNVVLIFIQPPALNTLADRMKMRGDSDEDIALRMQRVEMELPYAALCDYFIVNDRIERAARALRGIVLAERSRRDLLNLRVERGLPRHRFTYAAAVVPVFEDDMLYRDDAPHIMTGILAHGEFPHEAALRLLENELMLKPSTANLAPGRSARAPFIPPLIVNAAQQGHFEQVTFTYVYSLPERFAPPDGWRWLPIADADLPDAVTEALPAAPQLSPAK